MTSSIFIRSWRKDRFYLDYLLRSLAKFAVGFRDIVVAIPEGDKVHFQSTNFYTAKVVWVQEKEGTGYLSQQADKMHADLYCAGNNIFILDSDCFIKKPIKPEDFMANDKPVALIRHWKDSDTCIVWKPITAKFLKFEGAYETMCSLPIILERRILPLIRDYCVANHGMSITDYILSQPNGQFSEFNAALNFAMRFVPYAYDWRIADPATDGIPRDHLIQRWSWEERWGVEKYAEEYEAILAAP